MRGARGGAGGRGGQTVVAPTLAVDQLHFGYKVEPVHSKPPRWQPLRVFDDGLKTYIQFPVNMAATEAPPLFLVGPGRHRPSWSTTATSTATMWSTG